MALEEFTSGGSRDFRQRYNDVFGFFPKGDGTDVLVRVTDVSDTSMRFVDERGISYTAYADQGVVFRFIPVTKKLFFFEDKLVLASRNPARQYQRGICQANTRFNTITNGGVLDIDFDTIKAYIAEKGVLNKFLAFEGNRLYLYSQLIGIKQGDSIVLENSLFRQEVLDALRVNGLNYEVIV